MSDLEKAEQCLIAKFQDTLRNFKFLTPETIGEELALERFYKKFEVPEDEDIKTLHLDCVTNWVSFDQNLPSKLVLPPREWYKVRAFLHEKLKAVKYDNIKFPAGSEFDPTRGYNSIEQRLKRSNWSVTPDCREKFHDLVTGHKALKRAFRHRYADWHKKKFPGLPQRVTDKWLYKKLNGNVRAISLWKFCQVTTLVQGSRFSSVYKKKGVRRPINVEPIGNILVQLAIGSWLRDVIKDIFGVDLDHTQEVHRKRISDWIATIDFKNASDSVSLALCEFVFPNHFLRHLNEARSPMVYDKTSDSYVVIRKLSAMGNGFTFEVMTLLLLAVSRVLDETSSVFGDDVTISNDVASRFIEITEAVGFVVNKDKSFVNSKFRESCGAFYHDDFGYIESYDFNWPETMLDCVLIYNKCVRLSNPYGTYYKSFTAMRNTLLRQIPRALRGGYDQSFLEAGICQLIGVSNPYRSEDAVNIPPYFVSIDPDFKVKNVEFNPRTRGALEEALTNYKQTLVSSFYGYQKVNKLASPFKRDLTPARDWAKYEMYLYSNRVSKDELSHSASCKRIAFVDLGVGPVRANPKRWADTAPTILS